MGKNNTVKFQQDLKFGELGESEIVKYYESLGLLYLGNSSCLYPDQIKFFDLVFKRADKTILVEVKTDKYVSDTYDTDNIVIEFQCNRKPSGIKTTKAHIFTTFFYHKSVDNVWSIHVKKLKELIETEVKTGNIQIKTGGDNDKVKLYAIPRNKFKHFFKVDTLNLNTYAITTTKTNPYHVVTYSSVNHLKLKNPLDSDGFI